MEISLINFYICCCCQTTLHGLEVPGETEEYDLLQQSGVHTSSETCRVLHQVSQGNIRSFLYSSNRRKPSTSPGRSQGQDSYDYFKREKPKPKHDNTALHESIKQVKNEESVQWGKCQNIQSII